MTQRTDVTRRGKLRRVLAQNVRRLRRAARLTQTELSLQSGYSHRYVGMLEREEHAATVDVIEQLAAILDVEPSDLLVDSGNAA